MLFSNGPTKPCKLDMDAFNLQGSDLITYNEYIITSQGGSSITDYGNLNKFYIAYIV